MFYFLPENKTASRGSEHLVEFARSARLYLVIRDRARPLVHGKIPLCQKIQNNLLSLTLKLAPLLKLTNYSVYQVLLI